MTNVIVIKSTDNDTVYTTFTNMQAALHLSDDTEVHCCVHNPLYDSDSSLDKSIDKAIDKVIPISKLRSAMQEAIKNEINRYCNYIRNITNNT